MRPTELSSGGQFKLDHWLWKELSFGGCSKEACVLYPETDDSSYREGAEVEWSNEIRLDCMIVDSKQTAQFHWNCICDWIGRCRNIQASF